MNGVGHSYLKPMGGGSGLAWPTSLLALLVVFLVGFAPDALAQDITRYEFPFLSNSLEQAKVLANAFGTQMLLFTSAVGAGMPAFTYLAAFATLIGALVLVFMRQFQPTVVFTWLLCVGLVLFVPLNSRLLFTPIDIQQNNQQFLVETQLGVVDSTALKNLPVFSRFNHSGRPCAEEPMGCGFTPQLVAVHLASTMQLIFSDLFRSTQWSGLLERMDADNKLRSHVAFNLGDTWLREADAFRQTCGRDTDVIGDYVNRTFTSPEIIEEASTRTGPTTFKKYWEHIREVYASSLDNSSPPPIAVLPATLEEAQKLGWGDNLSSAVYQSYFDSLSNIFFHFNSQLRPPRVGFEGDTIQSGGVIQRVIGNGEVEYIPVKDVLLFLESKGFFRTIPSGNVDYQGRVDNAPSVGVNPVDEDLRVGLGFFIGPYKSITEAGNGPGFFRMCFRDTFTSLGQAYQSLLPLQDNEDNINTLKSACISNHGYPENYMRTFNLIDKTLHNSIEEYVGVSRNTLENANVWSKFYNTEFYNTIMNMPVGIGFLEPEPINLQAISINNTRAWYTSIPIVEEMVGQPAAFGNLQPRFAVQSNIHAGDVCRIDGQRLIKKVVYVLDSAVSDRGGKQPDNLFGPLINILTRDFSATPSIRSNRNGGRVISDQLELEDLVDVSALPNQEWFTASDMDNFRRYDGERYKLASMLRDDLNETLRRVQGRSDQIKQAALVYRMMELAQSVTTQQNPNAITNAMTAANEDGSTPRIVGWTAFTNFYGELGSQVTEEFLQWYVLIVGPIAYMTIHFLTIMIDLSLYALIALTPFLLLIGIMAPKRALGILVITILPVFVLKFVPVTLILLNNIAGMVYDLLPGAMGGDGEVAQAMLIMGMASLYTGLIGLTMYLLFKFGDAGAFMGGLTGLDKAAQEAAQTANTIARIIAGAAAAIIVGGPAALAGGMSWSKIKKNWGKGGTPPNPDGNTDNGGGGGNAGTAAAQSKAAETPNPLGEGASDALSTSLEGYTGENDDAIESSLQNMSQLGFITNKKKEEASVYFEDLSNANKPFPIGDGRFINAKLDSSGNKLLLDGTVPVAPATGVSAAPFGGAPNPAAADDTAARTADPLAGAMGSDTPPAPDAADPTTAPADNRATDTASKTAPSAGAQAGAAKPLPAPVAGVKDKVEEFINQAKEAQEDKMQKFLNGRDAKSLTGKDKTDYTKMEKDLAEIEAISATAAELGTEFVKDKVTDMMIAAKTKKIGADASEFTTWADAGKLMLSGMVGGARGIMKGAGGIPILGDLIGEVSNEFLEGKERAKAWDAAGGMFAYRESYYNAQRMKMYQQQIAHLAPGEQYKTLEENGGFQSMASIAKFDAATQASKMRSELNALISQRFGDGSLNIDNIDVKSLDFTAKELSGLGMVNAAQKFASVHAETSLMQDESMKVQVWNQDTKKFEEHDFKPTATNLGRIYNSLAVKNGNKYFDEAMVSMYGVTEKYGRADPKWTDTRTMAYDKKAAAKFAASDIDTDYLVGGHNKMVEGKLQFYEARGRHAEYVKLRNEDAYRLEAERRRVGASKVEREAIVDKIWQANASDVKGDTLWGKSRAEVLAGLTSKEQKGVKDLGADWAKAFKKGFTSNLGGNESMPLGGMFEEALQRGQYGVRTKSRIAKRNISTMEAGLFDAELKADVNAVRKYNLSSRAMKKVGFEIDNVKYEKQEADKQLLEKSKSTLSRAHADMFQDVFLDVLGSLSAEGQNKAIAVNDTVFRDKKNRLYGRAVTYNAKEIREAMLEGITKKVGNDESLAKVILDKVIDENGDFAKIQVISDRAKNGSVKINTPEGEKDIRELIDSLDYIDK